MFQDHTGHISCSHIHVKLNLKRKSVGYISSNIFMVHFFFCDFFFFFVNSQTGFHYFWRHECVGYKREVYVWRRCSLADKRWPPR